ncbi:MAG: hypothetical protein ACYCPN_06735 [Thermoplasmata archaeon]
MARTVLDVVYSGDERAILTRELRDLSVGLAAVRGVRRSASVWGELPR